MKLIIKIKLTNNNKLISNKLKQNLFSYLSYLYSTY